MTRLENQNWLTSPATAAVFDALEAAGGPDCARFVGGSVRNALVGRPVDDFDIATRLRPEDSMAALKAAGIIRGLRARLYGDEPNRPASAAEDAA